MRVRSLVALALIVTPAAAEAQRFPMPRIRDRGPARPVPLPPTARPIAREMVYVRMPYSVETYPIVSYFRVPGLEVSSWTSAGMGTHLDYRAHPRVSVTLDMTSSFLGGPGYTQTLELGTRVRPGPRERKWHPFLDFRAGYVATYERDLRRFDLVDPSAPTNYSRLNHGLGGVAGTGLEYDIHPRWTLTTAASVFRGSFSPLFQDDRPVERRYTMTAARYTVGLRYTPGRWTMPPNLPQQIAR